MDSLTFGMMLLSLLLYAVLALTGSLFGTVLLRAAAHWVQRVDVPVRTAFRTMLFANMVNLTLAFVVGVAFDFDLRLHEFFTVMLPIGFAVLTGFVSSRLRMPVVRAILVTLTMVGIGVGITLTVWGLDARRWQDLELRENNCRSMEYRATDIRGSLAVSFGGQQIQTYVLGGSGLTYSLVGADVSACAGQRGELGFAGGAYLDNVEFADVPIPERASSRLLLIGILLAGLRLMAK